MFSAFNFFSDLTQRNLLAQKLGFQCAQVSSLEGFHELLRSATEVRAMVCVSDTSTGFTDLINAPRTRRLKTVFMAMRHGEKDEAVRQECFTAMNELFNQFMSVLLKQKVKLQKDLQYLDSRITFQEIDRFFYTGAACAHFTIAIDTFVDLTFKPEQWTDGALPS